MVKLELSDETYNKFKLALIDYNFLENKDKADDKKKECSEEELLELIVMNFSKEQKLKKFMELHK